MGGVMTKDSRLPMHKEFNEQELKTIGRALISTFQTIADDLEVANGKLTLSSVAECTLDAGYMVEYGKNDGMTRELYNRMVKNVAYSSLTRYAKEILRPYI